ncbi:MAG: hypothetical protein M3316_09660 [Actinomycetota bacterium]|jgi:hypothetical protein|nr:hypothetical protein [Actinomycetota bacterium]
MRSSGCLNLVFVLVLTSVATALTAAGVVLFLSFAALTFESPTGIETILGMVVALIAAYFFVRVGLSVWRDLRGPRPTEGSGKEERGPAGNGGR